MRLYYGSFSFVLLPEPPYAEHTTKSAHGPHKVPWRPMGPIGWLICVVRCKGFNQFPYSETNEKWTRQEYRGVR